MIVIPLMVLELLSGIFLLTLSIEIITLFFLSVNFLGIIITWISTFTLSVHCHKKLFANWNLVIIQKLITTSWPRTIIWSLRSIFLSVFLYQFLVY